MAPVFTLTGNLLAERTLDFAGGWSPGGTYRASHEHFQVGGKGINVAKMLHRLGVPVTAIAFVGGHPGEECREWLAQAGFATRLFPTRTPTRTGWVARAPGQPETTWLAPDRVPDPAALAACSAFVATLPPGSILAICGSIPGWRTPAMEPLRDVIAAHAGRGRLVVDTYGDPLTDLADRPAALIKINQREWTTWAGLRPDADVAAALRTHTRRSRAAAWVVTSGGGPIEFASHGEQGQLQPPAVEEVSATGCGDVLLAGLIKTYTLDQRPLRDALQMSIPLAAANAASPGVADFTLPPGWLDSDDLQLH